MGQISASVELPARPEKVWEVSSNPNNFEKWLTLHVKWKGDVPAEFSKGAQVTEVISMMGMPNTITWTVDEYQPPSKVVISGTGMAGVKVSIEIGVVPAGEGSTFNLRTEFVGQMIVGALGKAIEKQGQKELETSLEKFKALVV
ncbi:MAG: type II toxin-antitoxin system Rv0910 family toxin [Micromonosporaceae bacterium]